MQLTHEEFDKLFYGPGSDRSHLCITAEFAKRKIASLQANPQQTWLPDLQLRHTKSDLEDTQRKIFKAERELAPLQSHLRKAVEPVVIEHAIDSSCLYWNSSDSTFQVIADPKRTQTTIHVTKPHYFTETPPAEVARVVAKSLKHTLEHVGAHKSWKIHRRGPSIKISLKAAT